MCDQARFYNLSEILTPTLAWGFFGPDENLNALMGYFKDQVSESNKGRGKNGVVVTLFFPLVVARFWATSATCTTSVASATATPAASARTP